MPGARIKWNADKLVSLSAMSISFITLVIFIYQTNLMRKQNYISIMPYLQVATTDDKATNTFELNLKNHGVGPAIIESVVMKFEGKSYDLRKFENQLFFFLKTKAPALDSLNDFSSSTLDRGIALPANSKYNIFAVQGSERDYRLVTETLQKLLAEGLEYEIIYRSIQGERWRIRPEAVEPEPLH